MSADIPLLKFMPSLCGHEHPVCTAENILDTIMKVRYLMQCRDVIGIYVSPTKHIGVNILC